MTAAGMELDELFRDVILDHARHPRNYGELDAPTVRVEGVNPTCGDEIRLDLELEHGVLCDIAFGGAGCSISQSSASLLTERLKGRGVDEATAVSARFRAMLLDGEPAEADLGDLEYLRGVAKFPVRVKCALLCWNVLEQGLREAQISGSAAGGN